MLLRHSSELAQVSPIRRVGWQTMFTQRAGAAQAVVQGEASTGYGTHAPGIPGLVALQTVPTAQSVPLTTYSHVPSVRGARQVADVPEIAHTSPVAQVAMAQGSPGPAVGGAMQVP